MKIFEKCMTYLKYINTLILQVSDCLMTYFISIDDIINWTLNIIRFYLRILI